MMRHLKNLFLGLCVCLTSYALATPEDFFVLLLTAPPESVDPIYFDGTEDRAVVRNVYEGLVGLAPGGTVAPMLATDWEVSEDGLQYTFTLREGVTFHTGNPFTCQDAEYSLQSILVTLNNESGYLLAPSILGFERWDDDETILESTPLSVVTDAVSCNDSNQLVVRLLEANPDFLKSLHLTMLFDKAKMMELGGWSGTEEDWKNYQNSEETSVLTDGTLSLGTGAYQLVSHDPTSRSIFKRFEGYWGTPATIENVIVQYLPDANTQLLALKNAEADAVLYITANYAKQLDGNPGVVVDYVPSMRREFIYLNPSIEDPTYLGSGQLDGKGIPSDFFSDIHVRKGFAAALDYDFLLQEIFSGQGKPSSFPAPSAVVGDAFIAPAEGTGYDPARAEEEFKQAFDGQVWDNGFTLELWYFIEALFEEQPAIAEVVKANIEALNPKFRVNIVPQTDDLLYDEFPNVGTLLVDYNFTTIASLQDTLDPIFDENLLFFSEPLYDDATLQDLLDQSRFEADSAVRQSLFEQTRDHVIDNAYLISLPEQFRPLVYREELKGVSENFNPLYGVFFDWKTLSK
jgi:peptide/nickel transport system substrate-binding protein